MFVVIVVIFTASVLGGLGFANHVAFKEADPWGQQGMVVCR